MEQQRHAQAATDPQGPTGRLATWLHTLQLQDVPETARLRAKYLTLDGLACALVGAQLPWSRVAAQAVLDLDGKGPSSVIGWGRRTTPAAAALLNGTFIQGFELDDYHPIGPLHSASVVLPALFGSVQRGKDQRYSGAQFLLAAIAGYEVGPRVGMALHGRQMLSRGWHSGAVFGTPAAAAAAAKLFGLDAGGIEDALGLGCTQSAGLMAAQFEAMSKRMHHGFSARNGLYAAVLAQGGYTGIKRVFERDYGGFLSTFGEGHAPDAGQIADTLGQRWETERIAIKPYAAMGALHAAIDGILAMNAESPLQAAAIEHIDIAMSHSSFHHGGWTAQRPLTAIGAQMNMAYAVAVAILDGAVLPAQFSPQRLDSDEVWALMERIHTRHEPAFDNLPQEKRQMTHVAVTLRDGSSRRIEVPVSRAAGNPLSNAEIMSKYLQLTGELMDKTRQSAIAQCVLHLEQVEDARELIELLAAPVRGVFD